MNKDPLKQLFKNLAVGLDTATPSEGHEMRFLEKLDATTSNVSKQSKLRYLKPILSVAASLVILFSVLTVFNQKPPSNDLASVSKEMATTQDFFTQTITSELNKINNQRTPETNELINDALSQLNFLEKEYEQLKTDLQNSGNDKRVVYAMISNFQSRIDILQNVLEQIEHIKEFKNTSNENTII